MARRRGRTVYRTVRKYGGRRKGGFAFGAVIDGLLAGIAGQLASKWIGQYGHPAASIGVGIWRNNNTLKTEGGRELGAALASQLPIIGGTSPYAGVY